MKKSLQIIGPFISNYSLARVNRGLATALSKSQDEYSVHLYQDQDKLERIPTETDLKNFPEIKRIWRKEKGQSDVVVYNDFPKAGYVPHGLKSLPGKVKLMYLAWEESVYPKMWVDEINENLHGIAVASSFVQDILRKAGVKIPMRVIPNAIDEKIFNLAESDDLTLPSKLITTKKKFKFLHVSTGRKRKGVDVLLKAYFSEFTKDDDVCLIIKSFPGPENMVNELLAELKTENAPEVQHIYNSELTDKELTELTASCDCAVYPSRAEGFGLPIAEAMLLKVPVIATNYSAYLDFVDETSGSLIDYKLVDATDSEMINLGAKWAEPDAEDLRRKMREMYDVAEGATSTSRLHNIINTAYTRAKQLTWESSAKQMLDFAKEIEKTSHLKKKKIAMLGKINSEDGISEYTIYICGKIENAFEEFYYLGNKDIDDRVRPDAPNVFRTWETGETKFEETIKFVKEKDIDIVHIQYHSGNHFPFESLENLIVELKNLKKEVVVTLHAVKGPTFDFIQQSTKLNLSDKIIIHNFDDFEYAKTKLNNIVRFPIPISIFRKRDKRKLKKTLGIPEERLIIASHGLMNSNKNIPNLIEAINILKKDYPDILFLSINAVSPNNIASGAEFEKAQELVMKYNLEDNVRFFKDFLDVQQIQVLLQISNINILAYTEVGESSSEAVRKCLASLNPTIVTDIKMFSEFKDEVYKMKSESVKDIVESVKALLDDKKLQSRIVESTQKFIELNSHERKAVEMLRFY